MSLTYSWQLSQYELNVSRKVLHAVKEALRDSHYKYEKSIVLLYICYCYIPRLSISQTSIVAQVPLTKFKCIPTGICAVVARAPNTTARDQCMTA